MAGIDTEMADSFLQQQDRNLEASPQEFLEEIEHLLTQVRRYMTSNEIQHVIEALHMVQRTCRDVPATAGRRIPPLEHALAVSTILAEIMHTDAVGVASGLVFEAVDAGRLELAEVERVLGPATSRVVGSMERLNILERKKQSVVESAGNATKTSEERDEATTQGDSKKRRIREAMRRQQAETVRKMFIGMADDPRVVLLKLAYRLHAMRVACAPFYQGDAQERTVMAQETREIYAPLAGRLGMSRIESELEDLAFHVLEPEMYEWVQNEVESESKQWRSYVEDICSILRHEMQTIGVKAEVSGRVKHLYSFYKKLVRNASDAQGQGLEQLKKAVDINQIHDLIAFRILVDTTQDCYIALGHVHSLWKPKEGRIKDFIANPKTNGYSAIHTTVFCKNDQLVEIQIRTHEMHEMAEYGVAMHWHYKDVGDHASSSAKELLSWLRQLTEWQREIRSTSTSDTDFVEAVKDDIFQEQIFVFTPKGEVKDLPVGSTPLDFAYRVHSKIGDSCAGARIVTSAGGYGERLATRMVPLDYELKSGDVVDIVTNRTAHPTRDWLSFAQTAAAKSKIRRYLKLHERHINVQIGRERLDRELKILSVAHGIESLTEDSQRWLFEEYRMASFEDLLAAIGADDVRPHQAAVRITDYRHDLRDQKETKDEKVVTEPLILAPPHTVQKNSAQLEVAGVSGLLTKLANCCCPLPGDEIVGYTSRGKGVIVHRTDCRNLTRYQDRDRDRLIHVSWVGMQQTRYLAPVLVKARDRAGLIRDIATVVSDVGVNMTAVNTRFAGGRETVLITTTLAVQDMEQLHRLFTRLEKIKDVQHVERDMGKRG
jgi:GTP pyrophosphokinase